MYVCMYVYCCRTNTGTVPIGSKDILVRVRMTRLYIWRYLEINQIYLDGIQTKIFADFTDCSEGVLLQTS